MRDLLATIAHHIRTPTPLQPVITPLTKKTGVNLYVKRDDLTHSAVSGNKWRKLKFNLFQADAMGASTLVTVGGAYSNHISAVAAAGKLFGFRTVGIIRQVTQVDTPTLQQARRHGMEIHFVDAQTYRNRDSVEFQQAWRDRFELSYFLPEGGTNSFALPGCAEIISELNEQLVDGFDLLITAVGSGGTLAGIAQACTNTSQVLGIAVVNDPSLSTKISALFNDTVTPPNNWRIDYSYLFGGYANAPSELLSFMRQFFRETSIPTDPVYTGKMSYAVYKMIERGDFAPGTRIVMLHTGGLQGNAGFAAEHAMGAWS